MPTPGPEFARTHAAAFKARAAFLAAEGNAAPDPANDPSNLWRPSVYVPEQPPQGYGGRLVTADNMVRPRDAQTQARHEDVLAMRKRNYYATLVERKTMSPEMMADALQEDLVDTEFTLRVRRLVARHGKGNVTVLGKDLPRGLEGVKRIEEPKAKFVKFELIRPEDAVDPQAAVHHILDLVDSGGGAVGTIPTSWKNELPTRMDDASLLILPNHTRRARGHEDRSVLEIDLPVAA